MILILFNFISFSKGISKGISGKRGGGQSHPPTPPGYAPGFLLQNGYPEQFLDHCFRTFLSKVFDSPIKQLTAPKLQISLVLPFTDNHGL